MTFITDNDYSAILRDEIKAILLEGNGSSKLSAAEQMAIAQIKNYLSGVYDTTAIFTATGEDRNSHIVMVAVDCTLYHLYTSIAPDQIPQIRSERYGDAMDWLKSISNGETTADLPIKKTTDGNASGLIQIKSKHKPKQQRW